MLTRLYDLLSSWKLSVVLTVSGALYQGFLAIWAARSPAATVQIIAGMSPFVLLWSLLLVNTLLCMLRRLPGLWKQTGAGAVLLPGQADWEKSLPAPPDRKGWTETPDGGRLWVRRRFSALGTLLLHLAVFLLALGFWLSSLSRFEGKFTAGEGEALRVEGSAYASATPPVPLTAHPPAFNILAKEIRAEFWEDELLFTRFTSSIQLGRRTVGVAINDPAYLGPFTSVRLSSFGYAVRYLVAVEGVPAPVEEGAVKLNIFPPGTTDSFQPQNFPHRFYLAFYPDFQRDDKGDSSRSMNLKNPRLRVDYYRGKIFLGRKVVAFGDALPVEEFTIAFLGVVPTAEYTVVRDVGVPVLWLAFLVALAGLLLRVRGKRGELLASPQPDGSWRVTGRNIEEVR
jgi:hypothetical protein